MTEIIKVEDLLDDVKEASTKMQMSESDALLLKIFGAIPDYSDEKVEKLWQEVHNEKEPSKFYDYCKGRGVDVLCKDGTPVKNWRDITVVLKADEQGLL